MKNHIFSLFAVGFALLLSEANCKSNVPAILWNIKGDSLHIKPVSAFEVSSREWADTFIKENLNSKSTAVLVFLTEQLSLEDFSSGSPVLPNTSPQDLAEFLDSHPHMLLPHVQNAVKFLHGVKCEVEEINIRSQLDKDTLQLISSALDNSCVVILRVPGLKADGEKSKKSINAVKDFLLPSLSTSKKNVIGMLTASRSSWSSSLEQHKARRLLADVTETAVAGNFFNLSDCLIMYATSINLTSADATNQTTVIVPFKYDLDGSECAENASADATLIINFSEVEKYSTLTLRLKFERKGNFYKLQNSTIIIDGRTEATEPSYTIEASLGFSYSCGTIKFGTTNTDGVNYIVTIFGFQIQPYGIKDAFSPSFDCVPFFTLPIWMGLMVGILFIIILNTGVYALFAAKTMDRFDDPKGKSISVASSAD